MVPRVMSCRTPKGVPVAEEALDHLDRVIAQELLGDVDPMFDGGAAVE
jgi:hypothetical protein